MDRTDLTFGIKLTSCRIFFENTRRLLPINYLKMNFNLPELIGISSWFNNK